MEQTVAERPLSQDQQIDHPQTCNNFSVGSGSHLREDPSESSFQSGHLRQDKRVCHYFLQGKCYRGTSCKFEHSESDGQYGFKPHVCNDFLGGGCNRVSCKFLHPESDKSNGCGSTGKNNLGTATNSGKFQCYEENLYRDSRTSFFPREHRSISPCWKFRNGMCYRGESYSFLQSDYAARSRNDYSTPSQQGVATTSGNRGFGERHRGNTLWTSQEHGEANEGNAISTRVSSIEHRSKSPCPTFLRGRCYRGAASPYYRPDTHVRSRNDGTPPWHRGPEATSVNPSFGKGKVDMTSWTSVDHGKGNEGNGQSTVSFYAGKRSRYPCHNFIRGLCNRGAHCSYLHTNTGLRDDCIAQKQQQAAVTLENPSSVEGNINIISRTESKVGSDRISMSFSTGYRRKSPCRNFLRGRCSHGAFCPYLHLDNDAYVWPKDNCSTLQDHEVAAASENPGFGDGREGIILRTSQEHERENMDEDLRSSYFPRGPRSRSPCRKFLSGRCYRGASCHYLHLETYDRSRDIARSDEQNRDKVNMGIISRSWSPDRQRSRPLGNLGADKPRPEVCLKYGKGRCTLGESCKYLHSFHEYAKSAPDLTKPPHFESAGAPRNSGGLHQCDPLMKRKEPDGFFDEKNKGKHADNAENPNITDVKDEPAVRDQQKCEVFGEETARNCDCFQADEKNILCHESFKRRRSSSRSPSSPRDSIDGRKTGIDESQDNCHWQRRKCGFPFAPGEDFGHKKIKRDESYNNIPKGRCHYAAPSRLPYSHSYRYNGPKNYINKEPQSRVAASVVDPYSHDISEDPNVMDTQGRDEAVSHQMHLNQCLNINLDSNTRIINSKNGAESVKDAVQPSLVVRDCSEPVTSKGENSIGSVVASDTTCSYGGNRSSPMDTNRCASNKDDNAEVSTDLSRERSEKTDSKKPALKTYVRNRKRCSKYCKESFREVIDPSTCGLPINSAVEASLSQSDMSGARVSDSTQDVITIGHPVQQLEKRNLVTAGIQNNDVSVQGSKNDGSSVVGYSKSNSKRTSQSSVKSAIPRPRRKLLVLDVNGLLADFVNVGEVPRGYKPDTIITMKAVFKRPFCDDFLGFCFDRFDVGVWSSRNKNNVDRVVDFLMLNTKKRLLFCWDQAHCTKTGYNTVENRDKPLVLKELKKLWEEQETDLPWEKGFYDETNTVLVDDSPYKALCNPPYTAIFPYAYKFRDARDKSLGRGGELRVYLEKLAATDNVQKFIEGNPFGQRPITKSNLSWGFYSKIVVALANQQEGSSNDSPGMKVITSPVSQLERDEGTSPASSSDGDHEEQPKGNAEDSHATKSAGDHTQRQEENADKVDSTRDLGSHLDGQDGTVDNSLATRSAATHVNQQGNAHTATHIPKENVNNTPHSKNVFGALSDRQVGNADHTSATNVQAHGSEQKGNAVGIPHS